MVSGGGLNSKLHAICDGQGRPVVMLLSKDEMSDHAGAAFLLDALPAADVLVTDRGYDSDGYRAALEDKGNTPCIPPRKTRKVQHANNRKLYRDRHRIENMFGRLKDWRRVATCYDRCAHTFMAANVIAATVIFWL